MSSHAQSIASSRAQLVASSCMQSAASSAGPSPSPLPSEAANDSPHSSWDLLHGPSPSVLRKQTPIELEVSNSEDEDQLGHDVANTGGWEGDDNGDDGDDGDDSDDGNDGDSDAAANSEGKEETMDAILEACGAELKVKDDIRG